MRGERSRLLQAGFRQGSNDSNMTTLTSQPLHETTNPLTIDPSLQAFWILRLAFVVAPIVAGIDKFTHWLVDWDKYLAPTIDRAVGGHGHQFMLVVGVVEVVAGIGVAVMPRVFAYVVAAWLGGIIVNLLMIPGYYDIALRDLGLALAAVALGRLSARHCAKPATA
jgi:uncharacterized membrane protein YphA (DoxX/SURF4 family)